MIRLAAFLLVLAAPPPAFAQNDVPSAEKPIAAWKFNAADEAGVPKTAAKFLEPSPRPPTYPAFAATNTATVFNAANPSVTVREAGLPGKLRFGQGDSITIEACQGRGVEGGQLHVHHRQGAQPQTWVP